MGVASPLNQMFANVEKRAIYMVSMIIYGMGLRHRVSFSHNYFKYSVFFRKYTRSGHELVAYEIVLLF